MENKLIPQFKIGEEVIIIYRNTFSPFYVEGRAKIVSKLKNVDCYKVKFEDGRIEHRFVAKESQDDPFDYCSMLNFKLRENE